MYNSTKLLLAKKKIVGVVGGDHSVPFGAIKALAEQHPGLGILHIDAHADLRDAYEGFRHSHASIMNNVALHTNVSKIVQVGIRDFCEEEFEFTKSNPKMETHFDTALKDRVCRGETWEKICHDIVSTLPDKVYISFDIDGLEPALCPHTGTPVAGGLRYHEALFLLKTLHIKGKKIVGFDLNEVAPGPDGDEWDGNVGARILYKMCGLALLSAGARS